MRLHSRGLHVKKRVAWIQKTVCDTSKTRRSRHTWPCPRQAQSDWVRVFKKKKLKLELLRGSRLKLESLPVGVVVHKHLVRAGCMFFGTATRRTLTRLHRRLRAKSNRYARTQKSSNSLIRFHCSNSCFLLETGIAGHERLLLAKWHPKSEKKLRKRPFFDSADRHEKLYGRSRLYASAQGRHETGGVLSLFSSLSFDISIKNSMQRWSSDFQGLFCVKIRKMAQGSNDLSTLPLNPRKSPGPDMISPLELKMVKQQISTQLSIIFNESLATGILPAEFKTGNISPILKPGKRDNSAKVLEKIVHQQLEAHFQKIGAYHEDQHGFMKGRSCADLLLATIDDWLIAKDHKMSTYIVFIDLSSCEIYLYQFLLIRVTKMTRQDAVQEVLQGNSTSASRSAEPQSPAATAPCGGFRTPNDQVSSSPSPSNVQSDTVTTTKELTARTQKARPRKKLTFHFDEDLGFKETVEILLVSKGVSKEHIGRGPHAYGGADRIGYLQFSRSLLLKWYRLVFEKGCAAAMSDVRRRAERTTPELSQIVNWESPKLVQSVKARCIREENIYKNRKADYNRNSSHRRKTLAKKSKIFIEKTDIVQRL